MVYGEKVRADGDDDHGEGEGQEFDDYGTGERDRSQLDGL